VTEKAAPSGSSVSVGDLLSRLIAAPTHNPGGDELRLARMLEGELLARGADAVELVEVPRQGTTGAYVLARFGTPRLLVNAHLDTVPPNAGWSADPFTARRVSTANGDRIVGLGAADTKGAIAAILGALDELRPRDVAILFSGDEERETTCMRDFLASGRAAAVARAIVCEPTGLRVGTRHRGIVTLELARKGQGGHSSRADSLPRPIADLARAAVALDEWARARVEEGPSGFRGTCMNIAQLDGGVAFNVVPEAARLVASFRPAPGADVPALRRELTAICAAAVPEATITWPLVCAPFATHDLGGFFPFLGARVEAPLDLGFWTEAALLSAAGIDAVVIGPGDIGVAHAPEESLSVADLEAARAMFVEVWRATR
jgi:acetylornithine deacetylase